jgi:hypothetical protein
MNKRKGEWGLSSKRWGVALSVPWLGLVSACSVSTSADQAPVAAEEAGDVLGLEASSPVPAFPTVAVTRGDTALDVSAVGRATSAAGVETILRRDFVEILQPIPAGIEQSWAFDHEPGSTGDLTIAVDAARLDYMTTDSDGIELRQPGGLDVHYSDGTWVDARGTRTGIPAHFDHGRIMLTVPAAVIDASTFPASLDPEVVVGPLP